MKLSKIEMIWIKESVDDKLYQLRQELRTHYHGDPRWSVEDENFLAQGISDLIALQKRFVIEIDATV